MLRFIYRWLIRLHPPYFKERFEMLSIFDQTEGRPAPKLLADGAVSLVRQWTLRPENWTASIPDTQLYRLHGDGPAFCTVDKSLPHRRALARGALLSAVLFLTVSAAINYDQKNVVLRPLLSFPIDWSPPASLDQEPARDDVLPGQSSASQSAVSPQVPTKPAPAQLPPQVKATSRAGSNKDGSLSLKPASPPSGLKVVPRAMILLEVSEQVLRSYTGTYVANSRDGFAVLIKLESGVLTFEIPEEPKRVLLPVSETDFVVANAPSARVDFSRNERATLQLDFFENGRHLTAHRKLN